MQKEKELLRMIELKTNKLIVDFQMEKEKNKAILAEQQKLLNEIVKQRDEIKKLEEKNKLLKIKNIVEDSTESKEMKLKINELVREIDKCIELLLNS